MSEVTVADITVLGTGTGAPGTPFAASHNIISSPEVKATGTAVPASAAMVGGSDGTNLRALKVASDGRLYVELAAGAQAIGTVTIAGTPTFNVGTFGESVAVGSMPTVTVKTSGAALGNPEVLFLESADITGWDDITDAPTAGQHRYVTDMWFSAAANCELRLAWFDGTTRTEFAAGTYTGSSGIRHLTTSQPLTGALLGPNRRLQASTAVATAVKITTFSFDAAALP